MTFVVNVQDFIVRHPKLNYLPGTDLGIFSAVCEERRILKSTVTLEGGYNLVMGKSKAIVNQDRNAGIVDALSAITPQRLSCLPTSESVLGTNCERCYLPEPVLVVAESTEKRPGRHVQLRSVKNMDRSRTMHWCS